MTSLKGKPESDLQKMWSKFEKDIFHTVANAHDAWTYVDFGDTYLNFYTKDSKKYRIEIKEVK